MSSPRRSISRSFAIGFTCTLAGACSSFSAGEPIDASSTPDAASASDAGPAETDAPAFDGGVGDAETPIDGGGGLVAFITDLGYENITTVASADAKCEAEAKGRLPGRFVAWFSGPSSPAPSRLVTSKNVPVDGPWYRVDGARVAANRAALSNTGAVPLENPIVLSATHTKHLAAITWTATRADGGVGTFCPNIAQPTTGSSGQVDKRWTQQDFTTITCASNASLALYCFQVE